MIQKPEENKPSEYKSSIKVAGITFLPPLISNEYRKQLIEYKRQAIRIEKNLQKEKELRDYIEKFYKIETSPRGRRSYNKSSESSSNKLAYNEYKNHLFVSPAKPISPSYAPVQSVVASPSYTLTQNVELSPCFALSHNVTLKSPRSCTSQNDALKISSPISTIQNDALESTCKNNPVLSDTYNSMLNSTLDRSFELPRSTTVIERDITSSLEHQLVFGNNSSPRPNKLSLSCNVQCFEYNSGLEKSQEVNENIEEHHDANDECQKSDDYDSLNVLTVVENIQKSPRSPLTPKPKLIRSNSYTLDTPSPILLAHIRSKAKEVENVGSPIHKTVRNCSSFDAENFVENVTEKKTSPLKGRNFKEYVNDISSICLASLLKNKTEIAAGENVNKSEEKGSLNTSPRICDTTVAQEDKQDIGRLLENNLLEDDVDIDSQLNEVLEKLPQDFSHKILELLDKQKDQLKRQFSKTDNAYSHANIAQFSTPIELSPTLTDHGSAKTNFNTSSQTLYYTMTSSNETLHNLISHISEDENIQCKNTNDTTQGALNAKKKLDYIVDKRKSAEFIQQNKAASIIGAAAKGFLTRRLFKTERVQSLILTIKEALVCAMELHAEDYENIQPADVELHRRLIQQVSAACFEFHEVFFDMPIEEQMLIISQDRQRQLEKLKRPTSSASRRSSSSLNTSKLSKTSLSSKKVKP